MGTLMGTRNTVTLLRTSTGAGIEGQIAVGASNLFLVVYT